MSREMAGSVENSFAALANQRRVARAFDSISGVFDNTFEKSPVIQRIRARVYREITKRVPPGSRILDVNCGTGIDAIFLASKGYFVDGVDISPGMIEQAREKMTPEISDMVGFSVASYENLPFPSSGSYDLVLSNFGGLNCTKGFEIAAKEIARVIRPQGYFIALVMPRFSLWESVSRLTRGQFSQAFRRVSGSTMATGFREETFTVYYHSPRAVIKSFEPWFLLEKAYGLNVLSPPPHASRFISRHPLLTRLMERLDKKLETLPFVRSIGDHFMVVLRRRASPN